MNKQISRVVKANTAVSKESAASVEELSSQADIFKNTVAKFRLE